MTIGILQSICLICNFSDSKRSPICTFTRSTISIIPFSCIELISTSILTSSHMLVMTFLPNFIYTTCAVECEVRSQITLHINGIQVNICRRSISTRNPCGDISCLVIVLRGNCGPTGEIILPARVRTYIGIKVDGFCSSSLCPWCSIIAIMESDSIILLPLSSIGDVGCWHSGCNSCIPTCKAIFIACWISREVDLCTIVICMYYVFCTSSPITTIWIPSDSI